ncbi:kelch motif-containing protein [Streptomyces sp. TRM 70351]|uniref:kelch motif-containing protein n=1 Tax=Streptomyces sp. TRM 70351 TaxID=3116552 RepID=UPI002E7AB491|nr:kelch motif-containing protein [Streptomyces sp. TRM 70351]MEE1927459.1 kelch motif-containing protein [Streptomyces sp. TRM 70351]
MPYRPSAQFKKTLIGTGVTLVLAGLNAPATFGFAKERLHDYRTSRPEYQARYGSWEVMDVPSQYQTNAIHAALLRTGKVLLIAGSGNKQDQFDAGTFVSVLWDPATNTFKRVDTPDDLFCAGHSQLADGRLLVAGGTARYEQLDGEVERAGGAMRVKNENPDEPRTFPEGTRFRAPDGTEYASAFPVLVPRADKTVDEDGEVTITAGEARVFVEAVEEGPQAVTEEPAQYEIVGLKGKEADNLYGLAEKINLDKQDFQGIKESFEFDPVAEKYVPVDPMDKARWYPTLVTMPDGKVLSVSGLDEIGEILPGDNELYDPRTKKWSTAAKRYFPTYPALFLVEGGKLFYSGSNAGYGPADEGRVPGIWDVGANTFKEVGGIKDPDQLETSSSLLLPPAQDQKVMVLGGGGVGESAKSTDRTAIVDLTEESPAYRAGPELPEPTRYLNSVILPDDTVFTTGGSRDYRGRGNSDILAAQIFDPATEEFREAAAPEVGRNYHAEALLLPDGRVATFGSDPLFADKDNTQLGVFEKRVEVYTPPYLHGGRAERRPVVGEGPTELERGAEAVYRTPDAGRVTKARLMRPSAVTHVTDVEQRSVALGLRKEEGRVTLTVPDDRSLIPPGWYMLFLTDEEGTPSEAKWVHLP